MNLLTPASDAICERLTHLWERTGDPALHWLSVRGRVRGPLSELEDFDPDHADEIETFAKDSAEYQDWVSTALMHCYKNSGDAQVFGLLYELNEHSFSQAIQFRLRRGASGVDGGDVLQEVFLNIYRYPHRFIAEKADSFRNWGHRIVRNTLLKFLKGEGRRSRLMSFDEDLTARPDLAARGPDRRAANAEIAHIADHAFVMYLNLYWLHFRMLSEKEQRALTMVEIEGASYKEAAAELGIRLENLKMVIFRGRRKVLRGMHRSLSHMALLQSDLSVSEPHAN